MTAVIRGLAGAVKQHSLKTAEAAPSVRGADWQTATVTGVNSNGTVEVGDIVARRLDAYRFPEVGDRIELSQASSGSWLARDRVVPATGDNWSPAWLALTLSGAWVANGGATDPPPAARLTTDGQFELSGMIKGVAVNASGNASIGLVPAAARATYTVRGIAPTSVALSYARIDVNPTTGAVTMVNGSVAITTASWLSLDGVRGRAR